MHPLAQHRTRPADDRDLDHAGPGHQHVLDLDREDLVAAAVEHVFLAVEHPHIAFGVDRAQVARMPVAGGEGFGGGLGVGPIAGHHHRTADPELAGLAGRCFDAVVVHHPDVGGRQCHAHRVGVIAGAAHRHHGDRRAGLGGAVGVDQREPRQPGVQRVDGGHRHRRAAVAADAPGRQVGIGKAGVQQAQVVHRRHHHGVADALGGQQRDEGLGFEGRHQDDGAAQVQHGHDDGHQPGDMAGRHCQRGAVARGVGCCAHQLHAGLVMQHRMHDVAVGQRGAFGVAGGARGVQDHRDLAVVGGRRRGRCGGWCPGWFGG